MAHLIVHKGRTEIVSVSLGFDVSNDIITSEIRVDEDPTSELIAVWDVSFVTDGTDGELLLTLDNSVTSVITKSKGYTDMKRVSGGEPLAVFEEPIVVRFKNSVTV
jgi:hypothetical protein